LHRAIERPTTCGHQRTTIDELDYADEEK
jgi:hypothetical protein